MEDVAVVPLQPQDPTSALPAEPTVEIGRPLRIVAGRLLNWSKAELGPPIYVLEDEKMELVEDILIDVLALQDFQAPSPREPSSPPGRVDYPRWGQIYYAGERLSDQRKRYVVVSNNYWNRDTLTSVVVRTTSQERRGGLFFPTIEGGAARACCGNVTTFPRATIDLRGSRPYPSALNLGDMALVAEGLIDALALGEALERRIG